jgi:LPS O-antigen subunit length determinant protein (WzzB/FepE family)
LWSGKWLILATVLVLGGLATTLAFMITPMYRAETVLIPVSEDESADAVSSLTGQIGGLASLVGGAAAAGGTTATESLAILTSRDFIEQFITDEHLLPVLFADRWNARTGQWQVEDPKDIPSLQDAFLFFNDTLYRIQQDRLTGLITMQLDWYDTALAVHWSELLVARLNQRMRTHTVTETDRSIRYLRDELKSAVEIELRQAMNRLVENQEKRAMYARIREDYALRVVGRPLKSDLDRPARPKRALMIVLGGFAGLLIGIAVVLVRYRLASARQSAMVRTLMPAGDSV